MSDFLFAMLKLGVIFVGGMAAVALLVGLIRRALYGNKRTHLDKEEK